jgi:hypothetical protein
LTGLVGSVNSTLRLLLKSEDRLEALSGDLLLPALADEAVVLEMERQAHQRQAVFVAEQWKYQVQ